MFSTVTMHRPSVQPRFLKKLMQMHSIHTSSRLPRSGNAALAAGALVQAALGLEFLFAGLSKAMSPTYAQQFRGFVQASPGSLNGPLAPIMQTLVLPNIDLAAQ